MKKFFAVLFIIFCMFAITGCDLTQNEILNNMSDLRINYFVGKGKNFEVILSCGYREEVFSYDGISTNPIECGVLSLEFFESHAYSSLEVLLVVDGEQNNYILEKSPFEDVFIVDIEKILTGQNKIVLQLKNQNEKIELSEISSGWNVDYKEALNIASGFYKDKINDLYFNNKLNAECYLKVIYKLDFGKTFWYFSIIDFTGENYSLLIDVESGEVISSLK